MSALAISLVVAVGTTWLALHSTVSWGQTRRDCDENLKKCLDTKLGKPHSGGVWGSSVCKDCNDRCRTEKAWPDKTYDGKRCDWWNVR